MFFCRFLAARFLIRPLGNVGDTLAEQYKALDCNVQCSDDQNDINDWLGVGIVGVDPRLIDSEANGDDRQDVSQQADETMTDFHDHRLHEFLEFEAELCEDSAERSNQGEHVSRDSEKGMRTCIMRLLEALFVEKDAGLGDGDKNKSRCL